MRNLLFILLLISVASSQQYVFLVNKYDKEIDLEAKIISEIATSSLQKDIKLYIPKISKIEKKVYSKYFVLSKSCENANFIFEKVNSTSSLCKDKNKLFFTNNYKKLIKNKKYFGAFFWNKSRPNIVFVKQRLSQKKISLPYSYKQFIEDFHDN